eukprot:TRINITY_DN13279_c0_g1_i1.p1 TRINITY_DN13279_c0_g1~~TRINITY_DN13279_c0_g1_i1.p1  ORF type:complete len:260 (+),score=33.21 TRINITY_DN13279_c0_g1_i1:43-780(+)
MDNGDESVNAMRESDDKKKKSMPTRMMRPSSGKDGYVPFAPSARLNASACPPPPRIASSPFHPHTLYETVSSVVSSNGQWQCDHCSNSTTIGMTFKPYRCNTCTFNLCQKCVEAPIHNHPLQVIEDTVSIYPEQNGHWCCDSCHGQTTEGLVSYMHHCPSCAGFDVCDRCLNKPLPQRSTPVAPPSNRPHRVGMLHVTSGKGLAKTFNMKPPMNPKDLQTMSKGDLQRELAEMRLVNEDPNLHFH